MSSGDAHTTRGPLPSWQLALYPRNHADRRNLLLHALSVPVFMAGTLAALVGLATFELTLVLVGLLALPLAMAAQGRGHRREAEPPVPFRGPGDVVARILVEQWITFPRFVLRGEFARAWRASGR